MEKRSYELAGNLNSCSIKLRTKKHLLLPESNVQASHTGGVKKSGICLLLALLCFAFSPFVQAQAKDFQIEVLLFENLRPGSAAGATLYVPRLGNSISLTGDKAAELGYQEIAEPTMLVEHAEQIKKSANYRLLSHIAWRQPGLDNASARGIRVFAGRALKIHLPGNYREYDKFVPVSATPSFDGDSREISTTTVSGTIKVRLGRFLHLDSRLVFTDTNAQRSYRLDHSRKMRSRELHFKPVQLRFSRYPIDSEG